MVAYTACVHGEAVSGVLRASQAWGLVLSQQIGERIGRFLVQLLRWNERVNLTGARSLEELLGDHVPDSFALAKLCQDGEEVMDIGAGGGLPGVPFALLRPDCRIALVEPRAKRVAFLNAAVREAEATSATVVRARLEDLGDSGCTVAASRATFPPDQWLLLARRILRPGGRAVVFAAGPIVALPEGCFLDKDVVYATASGAPRWAASFSFT